VTSPRPFWQPVTNAGIYAKAEACYLLAYLCQK